MRPKWKLSEIDQQTVWLRYKLWEYNRPADIARDFGITHAYVSRIGRGHANTPFRRTNIESDSKLIPRRCNVVEVERGAVDNNNSENG